MTPTIIDRIDSMIQAMAEVVIPAIDGSEYLARDQAGLVVAHLNMIRAQLPLADAFEQVELDAALALGRALVPLAAGGDKTMRARDRLANLLGADGLAGSRQDRCQSLNAAAEHLVRSSRIDGTPQAVSGIAAAVLQFGLAASWRDRVWFNGSGFDAEQQFLPDRTTIVD